MKKVIEKSHGKQPFYQELKNKIMNNETLKEQLVEYLMDENLETLTRIKVLETRFRKYWDIDEEDDSFDELDKLTRIWGSELKEEWGNSL